MKPSRRSRLSAALSALLAVVAVGAVVAAPHASAVPDATSERLAGKDRFETAAAVARATVASADTALIARGDVFPDALAGSALAGSLGAPLLLVSADAVPAATDEALADLGVAKVVVLGGEAAVGPDVEAALAERYQVSRVAGADRYATAAAVAGELGEPGTIQGVRTAFVATGTQFADALAAGPLAAAAGVPVLLTAPDALSSDAADALKTLSVKQVIILGGTGAVSDAVETEIESSGMTTRRVGGTHRAETAALVADLALEDVSFDDRVAVLARGDDFADALAGAPHGGQFRAPILLTGDGTLGDAARRWLTAHGETLEVVRGLGGEVAIPDAVLEQALAAARQLPPQALALDPGHQYAKVDAPAVVDAIVTRAPAEGSDVPQPAPGEEVIFAISSDADGVDSLEIRAVTDSQGVARARFSRSGLGTDTVVATVTSKPELTATAEVVWSKAAAPIALTPDEVAVIEPTMERSYTVSLQDLATGGATGGTVLITAEELLDDDAATDPGTLSFGGAATTDGTAGDAVLASVAVPAAGTATFTVTAPEATRFTPVAFVDANKDRTLDEDELRDAGGSTTWGSVVAAITLRPDDATTTRTGTQRVYELKAVDQDGRPFELPLHLAFVEATDNNASTTTQAEFAWVDNDATLATRPAADGSPTGTTELPPGTTETTLTPNEAGLATFGVTSDTVTAATPIAWQDQRTGSDGVRDAGEPADQGGTVRFESPGTAGATLAGDHALVAASGTADPTIASRGDVVHRFTFVDQSGAPINPTGDSSEATVTFSVRNTAAPGGAVIVGRGRGVSASVTILPGTTGVITATTEDSTALFTLDADGATTAQISGTATVGGATYTASTSTRWVDPVDTTSYTATETITHSGTVVSFDTAANRYLLDVGSDTYVYVEYGQADTFSVDGEAADLAGFETALGLGDTVSYRYSRAAGADATQDHTLTNP